MCSIPAKNDRKRVKTTHTKSKKYSQNDPEHIFPKMRTVSVKEEQHTTSSDYCFSFLHTCTYFDGSVPGG
jgi:hypothetical protein